MEHGTWNVKLGRDERHHSVLCTRRDSIVRVCVCWMVCLSECDCVGKIDKVVLKGGKKKRK